MFQQIERKYLTFNNELSFTTECCLLTQTYALITTPTSAVTKKVSAVSILLTISLSAESSFYLQGYIGSFNIHLANQGGFAVNML